MTSKILVDRDVLVQALGALEWAGMNMAWNDAAGWAKAAPAITALRAALAEPVQENNEPAAWLMTENPKYGNSVVVRRHKPKTYDADWWNVEPLYKLGDS